MFENDEAARTQDSEILKLRVSLKGRPIRSYVFTKDVITVGRDPDADVFLDNPGISREHLRIEKSPDGFFVEDLGSANGTYLNDELVRQRKYLKHEDILRIGKFSLWVSLEEDRRNALPEPVSSPTTLQGTTVLSMADLQTMMAKLKASEPAVLSEARPAAIPAASASVMQKSIRSWLPGFAVIFAAGLVLGIAIMGMMNR